MDLHRYCSTPEFIFKLDTEQIKNAVRETIKEELIEYFKENKICEHEKLDDDDNDHIIDSLSDINLSLFKITEQLDCLFDSLGKNRYK
jgi:hypothetical protein